MASIDGTRSAPQSTRTARPAAPQQPQPADARAMGEALASARRQMPPVPGKGGGLPQRPSTTAAAAAQRDGSASDMAAALTAARGRDGDAASADRFRLERDGGDASGVFGQSQTAAPAALPMPQMPSAMIDPSGFAQMLADLWTRENGKGHREVQVRFGDSAWPATGARLVRNAAGTLDVALLVDPAATSFGEHMPALERHLTEAGVALGHLGMEADG